jgi:hypothetical protein
MNTVKIKYVIILGLFLPLLFVSCKKTTNPNYVVISDEMKQWFLYQKGSYWIYQNDKTLQIDCTYITKDPSFWQSKFIKDDGSIGAIIDHIDISYIGNVYQSCNISSEGADINRDLAFNTNMVDGRKYQLDQYSVFQYIKHYDSLAINNHYFKNVNQTRYATATNNNGTDTLATTFFFAKYFGLIRFSQNRSGTDTTWNVVRYHIVQ